MSFFFLKGQFASSHHSETPTELTEFKDEHETVIVLIHKS